MQEIILDTSQTIDNLTKLEKVMEEAIDANVKLAQAMEQTTVAMESGDKAAIALAKQNEKLARQEIASVKAMERSVREQEKMNKTVNVSTNTYNNYNQALEDNIGNVNSIAGAVVKFINVNGGLLGAWKATTAAIRANTIALLANPIGAIAVLVTGLIATLVKAVKAFTSTTEGAIAMSGALAPLQAIVEVINTGFAKLGEVVVAVAEQYTKWIGYITVGKKRTDEKIAANERLTESTLTYEQSLRKLEEAEAEIVALERDMNDESVDKIDLYKRVVEAQKKYVKSIDEEYNKVKLAYEEHLKYKKFIEQNGGKFTTEQNKELTTLLDNYNTIKEKQKTVMYDFRELQREIMGEVINLENRYADAIGETTLEKMVSVSKEIEAEIKKQQLRETTSPMTEFKEIKRIYEAEVRQYEHMLKIGKQMSDVDKDKYAFAQKQVEDAEVEINKIQSDIDTTTNLLVTQLKGVTADMNAESDRVAAINAERRRLEKEAQDKHNQEIKDKADEVLENLRRSNLTAQEKELDDLERKFEKEKEILTKAGEDITELEKKHIKDKEKINNKYNEQNKLLTLTEQEKEIYFLNKKNEEEVKIIKAANLDKESLEKALLLQSEKYKKQYTDIINKYANKEVQNAKKTEEEINEIVKGEGLGRLKMNEEIYLEELNRLYLQYEAKKEILKDNQEALIQLEKEYQEQRAQLNTAAEVAHLNKMQEYVNNIGMLTGEQSAAMASFYDGYKTISDNIISTEDTKSEKLEKGSNIAIASFDMLNSATQSLGSTLMSYYEMQMHQGENLTKEKEEENRKLFEQSKKTQKAMAIVQMLSGIGTAIASAMQLGPIAGPIVGAINGAMVATTAGIQIAKIEKTEYDGGTYSGGGGTASTGGATPTPYVPELDFNNDLNEGILSRGNEDTSLDTRVYVLESDITNTQNKVKTTESESTF